MYEKWKNGAIPDPWAIYPNTPSHCLFTIADHSDGSHQWVCTRASGHNGTFHVARYGPEDAHPYGKLICCWDSLEDSDKTKPDVIYDEQGNVVGGTQQIQKKKPEAPTMVTKKDKSGVKKDELVYAGGVTFRADGGPEIVIHNEDEAIEWLQRRKAEREKDVAFTANIEGSYPSDGMIALMRVLRKDYGFVKFDSATPWGLPQIMTIPAGVDGKVEQVPWGKFSVPGIEGFLQTSIAMDKGGQPIFALAAKIKNKHKDKFLKLAERIKEDLKEHSIYRGHAIKVEFPDFSETPFNPTVHVPSFLDVRKADRNGLIFNDEVRDAIELSLFTPIEFSDAVRKYVGKLKRGVLLAGPPGTGKTLAAHVTAKLCEDNGWTFIYLSSTSDLAQSIGFAKMYQPAVVFAEDLDSIVCNDADDENRDEGTQKVLNTLDGMDTKDTEVMVVFTTNYPEKINKAMRRPGRLDAIISISPPDSLAVEKLMRIYGRGLVPNTEDISGVAASLAGNIPAVIREVMERSKLAAIPRCERSGERLVVRASDLEAAKNSMMAHLRMLNEKRRLPPSDIEKAANVVLQGVVIAMKNLTVGGKNGEWHPLKDGSAVSGGGIDETVKRVTRALAEEE